MSRDLGQTWSSALWSVGADVQTLYSSLALRGGPDGLPLDILYETEADGCNGPSCSIVYRSLALGPHLPTPPSTSPAPPSTPPPPPPNSTAAVELVEYRSVSYGCNHGSGCIQQSFLHYDWDAITTVVTFTQTNLTELCAKAHLHGVRVVVVKGKKLNTSQLANTTYTRAWRSNITSEMAAARCGQ